MTRSPGLPPLQLLRSISLRIGGRVRFPNGWVGEIVSDEIEDYRVFRQMIVDHHGADPIEPGAVLDVRFHFRRFSSETNRRLSGVAMPFIAVQPGFLSKTWMVGLESGAFRGLYLWAGAEEAARYLDSLPMRAMTHRALAGTLVTSITTIGSETAAGGRLERLVVGSRR